jgi:phage N-6-adenine-methyltransferase
MDFANKTNFVAPDCAIASPISQSTQTCADCTLNPEQLICSVPAHHVNPSPSKENVWEAMTSETASEQSCKLLEEASPNSFVSKTCPDYYQPPLFPEMNPEHISNRCSKSFMSVGTMRSGVLSEHQGLELSGEEPASYSLPRPGALSKSSPSSRPPGNTKSEAQAKKLGIIQKNEVFNPEWLEQEFGLPIGWTSPQECRAAIELLALVEPPSEISSTPDSLRSPSGESSISIPSSGDTIEELPGNHSFKLKAISLWQPWASLIPLGLKHYETRSWKTNYRGKLLICSTAANSKQHKEYLKICNELQLPPWSDFPYGKAIAICDLTDCIPMTAEFIEQQSQTEILCGDWQVGRYAWKLENIQPIAEPFAVKGKQGLFNVSLENYEFLNEGEKGKGEGENPEPETHNLELLIPDSQLPTSKKSDRWYTPPLVVSPVEQVLGVIDLDPCADEGKHIPAKMHYTVADDGLSREWHGRVFMNPPYSCPGKWMKKLQAEYESGRVIEAIALVPVATDTKWLSPVLKSQVVCFWTGRIKFLDTSYQPRLSARQAHCFVYWGENWQRFKEVFDEYGVVQLPLGLTSQELLGDKENNPSNLISPSKKRLPGEGNGYIHWRTITFNGKDYPQAYYHWKENGKKRTKYIPQHLLGAIQQAEQEKHPVIEILKLLGVESSQHKLLGDIENSPSNDDILDQLLGDKKVDKLESIENTRFVDSPSNSPSNDISPSKMRRDKGEGSGTIHWRTITKNGKDYPQAYYHYEFWSDGDRLTKSSRYIPKRLLSQVQQLEAEKAPVREILQVLGVVL